MKKTFSQFTSSEAVYSETTMCSKSHSKAPGGLLCFIRSLLCRLCIPPLAQHCRPVTETTQTHRVEHTWSEPLQSNPPLCAVAEISVLSGTHLFLLPGRSGKQKGHKNLFKDKSVHASPGPAVHNRLQMTGCLLCNAAGRNPPRLPLGCCFSNCCITEQHSSANSSYCQALLLCLFSNTRLEHVTWSLFALATLSTMVRLFTCAPVEVLVVDDDAVAHAGEVQAVPEAVAAALGVHLTLAGGGQGRP